ncbi:hypothetical protein TURU_021596 [Turdus rufiventris]|nr:hypothetical protein TURU_021596 [Turdus rufiventris]
MVPGWRIKHILYFWSRPDWAKGYCMSDLLLDLGKGLLLLSIPVEIVLLAKDQWRHRGDLIDDLSGDLAPSILPLYSQELDLSGRSFEFALSNGKAGSQQNLDDPFSFLKYLHCRVAPHNDVINVLKVFWSLTLLQCSLDQSMADGGAVFPPLGQMIPGVLHDPPGESKLRPALCC